MDRVTARLRLRDFQIAVTIAEKRSLRAAAIEVGVTQPALTYALREIEDIVGGQLFARNAHGIEPTEMGREFLIFAGETLRAASIGLRDVRSFARGVKGELKIGFTPTATAARLPAILMAFREVAPDVQVKLFARASRTQTQFLLAGDSDVVVGSLDEIAHDDNIESVHLVEEKMTVVGRNGHPLGLNSSSLAEVAAYPWIYPIESRPTADQIRDVFLKAGIEPPATVLQSSSLVTNREILAQTDFLAVLPEGMARTESERSGLLIVLNALPELSVNIGVLTLRRVTRHPIIELFMKTVRAQTHQAPALRLNAKNEKM